jgi:hypothetical protein
LRLKRELVRKALRRRLRRLMRGSKMNKEHHLVEAVLSKKMMARWNEVEL